MGYSNKPTVVTALPSAVRTALTTWDPITDGKLTGGASGAIQPENYTEFDCLIAYLNITAVPGVDTVLLKMQEQDPVSLAWSDVAGAATLAQVATGLVKMVLGPSIGPVAASASGVAVQTMLPPRWRLQVVPSAGSNFTYSLAVALYNFA